MRAPTITVAAFAVIGLLAAQAQDRGGDELLDTSLIYSSADDDQWNRIFTAPFTRKFTARVSNELQQTARHEPLSHMGLSLTISTSTLEQFEEGDRAIEPFYPSFLTTSGVVGALSEPGFSELTSALESALLEQPSRTPLQRAIMQSDLWAAFDILESHGEFCSGDSQVLLARRARLLTLISRLVRVLALSHSEIRDLPDNYSRRQVHPPLPKLFDDRSKWMETQWVSERIHDAASGYRRAARVFV